MQKLKLIALLTAFGLVTACSSNKDISMNNDITQLQGEWLVTEVEQTNLETLETEVKPFIGFDLQQNRIYGKSTCNNIMGGYNYDATNGSLSFTQVASTMMLCPFMEQEQLMLKALNEVKAFDVQGDKAYLLDKDHKVILKLNKK